MNDFITYIPTGVIIGILIKTFVDKLLNRARIEVITRNLRIGRYHTNRLGKKVSVHLNKAEILEVSADIVMVNKGYNSTAVTNVDIRIYNQKNSLPLIFAIKNNDKFIPNAFNMPGKSCVVINIQGHFEREEDNEYYFEDEDNISLHFIYTLVSGREKKVVYKDISPYLIFIDNEDMDMYSEVD